MLTTVPTSMIKPISEVMLIDEFITHSPRNAALKPGVDRAQNAQVLRYAAAATAFYRYSVLAANTGGIQSIRSGETTIGADPSSAVEVAAAVRDEFLTLAAPLLQDRQFGFRAV